MSCSACRSFTDYRPCAVAGIDGSIDAATAPEHHPSTTATARRPYTCQLHPPPPYYYLTVRHGKGTATDRGNGASARLHWPLTPRISMASCRICRLRSRVSTVGGNARWPGGGARTPDARPRCRAFQSLPPAQDTHSLVSPISINHPPTEDDQWNQNQNHSSDLSTVCTSYDYVLTVVCKAYSCYIYG